MTTTMRCLACGSRRQLRPGLCVGIPSGWPTNRESSRNVARIDPQSSVTSDTPL